MHGAACEFLWKEDQMYISHRDIQRAGTEARVRERERKREREEIRGGCDGTKRDRLEKW